MCNNTGEGEMDMAHESAPIDISKTGVPSLAEIAEEVRRTNRPRVLRRADEDVAVISPVRKAAKRSPFKPKSQADIDAFLSSAGGWKGIVDADKLREDIDASRALPIKPRPEL